VCVWCDECKTCVVCVRERYVVCAAVRFRPTLHMMTLALTEELLALLLDEAHAQDLALIVVDQLRGQHLDDHVGVLLLGVDVGVKVGLAALDGLLDGVQAVAALRHVALDLPRKLDLVGDVEVDLEVDQLADALVEEGVEALDDQDLGGEG
jgi:hypothetical protein